MINTAASHGHDMNCFPSSKPCLVCCPSQETHSAFYFNWSSQESLSKVSAKHQSAIKQPGRNPVNQLPCSAPEEPLLSGLHFLLLHYKCAAASSDFPNIMLLCRFGLMPNAYGTLTDHVQTNLQSKLYLFNNIPNILMNQFTSLLKRICFYSIHVVN